MPVMLDGEPKALSEIVSVFEGREKVTISENAVSNITRSRKLIQDIASQGKVVYGVTTGFGKFADVSISEDALKVLQKNLVMSHAAGVGRAFSVEEVRAAMFLRANALAKGMSGVRLEVVQTLVEMLNGGVVPLVFCGCQW